MNRTRKVWKAGPVLDQRAADACFGFGWAGALIARPGGQTDVSARLGNQFGTFLYQRMLNTTPTDHDNIGAQVARELGLIDSHHVPANITELRDAVLNDGPVVIVAPWYASMYRVNEKTGRIPVRPDTHPGSHCLFVRGYDSNKRLRGQRVRGGPAFLLRNSWGRGWGIGNRGISNYGDAWISERDLDRLLTETGYDSTCVPLGRRPIDVAQILAANA